MRDHLFISYAWEDEAFAEWLALKLRARYEITFPFETSGGMMVE